MFQSIVQYYFQLVRGNDIEPKLILLLDEIKNNESSFFFEFSLLYRLIGQTRDIFLGKGECDLSYVQLFCWWQYYPILAYKAFDTFVFSYGQKPYGSWKDAKNMCQYIYKRTGNENHNFIDFICNRLIYQLNVDLCNLNRGKISFAAKWAPRERKKQKWLFQKIAKMMYGADSLKKSFMTLRKTVAFLNKCLGTVEIKMCSKKLDDIDMNCVSSKATLKYNKFFSKNNFSFESCNTKKCEISHFVKMALFSENNNVNILWEKFKPDVKFENIIPLLDISPQCFENESLFNMIGLGIYFAEQSIKPFHNRLLLCGGIQKWVIFSKGMNFVEKVNYIYKVISPVQNKICHALVFLEKSFKKIELHDARQIKIILFSSDFTYRNLDLYKCIQSIFENIPRFFFVNVGEGKCSLNLFQDNYVLLSGSNIRNFNFLKKGSPDKASSHSSYSFFQKSILHQRYALLNKILLSF
jgi:hypothetical protein